MYLFWSDSEIFQTRVYDGKFLCISTHARRLNAFTLIVQERLLMLEHWGLWNHVLLAIR